MENRTVVWRKRRTRSDRIAEVGRSFPWRFSTRAAATGSLGIITSSVSAGQEWLIENAAAKPDGYPLGHVRLPSKNRPRSMASGGSRATRSGALVRRLRSVCLVSVSPGWTGERTKLAPIGRSGLWKSPEAKGGGATRKALGRFSPVVS